VVTYPTPIEDINVPRKAKVRIEPKFRKKFSCKMISAEIKNNMTEKNVPV
jgi:hypothetical protein